MAYDPGRNSEPKRALRAGLIAIARRSRVIEMADWLNAKNAPSRRPTSEEYELLKAMSVSDEVVMKVADTRTSLQAAGTAGLAVRLVRLRASQRPANSSTGTDQE